MAYLLNYLIVMIAPFVSPVWAPISRQKNFHKSLFQKCGGHKAPAKPIVKHGRRYTWQNAVIDQWRRHGQTIPEFEFEGGFHVVDGRRIGRWGKKDLCDERDGV